MSAREVPEGLPPPSRETDHEVPMCEGRVKLTQEEDQTVALWTTGMSACNCVATFNTVTRHRSLVHLLAGDTTGVAGKIEAVKFINENTVVILSNGFDSNQENFLRWANPLMDEIKFYREKGGKPAVEMVIFHTERSQDEATPGIVPGTFVIEPDGRYGRINQHLQRHQEQDQTQGQVTSRGMPGGGETTSRGLPGAGAPKSHGKGRPRTGKGGFWRMLFCCCMLRGRRGGGARGSKATTQREKRKVGIWRRMVCCCFK